MTWDLTRLLAILVWPPCGAIFVIAGCRLNAMPTNTRWPVVIEYAIWGGIGITVPLLPLIGEWPGPGMVLLMYGLMIVLLCSARAWAGDVAPDEATDVPPLEALALHQRASLAFGRLRAWLGITWKRAQFWKVSP